MSEYHVDLRRVGEVISLAIEMLAEGTSPRGILAKAVRRMGLEPRLGLSGKSTEGYALWTAAIVAERVAAPIGLFQEAYYRTSYERSEALRKTARTLRDHALSIAIFCGALAGALDPDIMAVLAKGDAASAQVALDLAEERGLHEGGYGPERYEEWAEATGHEHVWLPWESGDAERTLGVFPGFRGASRFRRCTCGVFEHEAAIRCSMCAEPAEVMLRFQSEERREPVCYRHWSSEEQRYSWSERLPGRETPAFLPGPDDCHVRNCQRERGHDGLHMSRSAIHSYSGIEEQIDEWGDVETGTAGQIA